MSVQNQSNTILSIFPALIAAQSEIGNVIKESHNPFFKSNYADLASIKSAIREPLANNGLGIIQNTVEVPAVYADGVLVSQYQLHLETTLIHTSGEWIKNTYPLTVPTDKGPITPQTMGSAVTYARRYAIQCILCLASEDFDGEAQQPANNGSYKPTSGQSPNAQNQAPNQAQEFLSTVKSTKTLHLPEVRARVRAALEGLSGDVRKAIGEEVNQLLLAAEQQAQNSAAAAA